MKTTQKKMVKVLMLWGHQRYWQEVEGRSVSFSGFTEYQFILHRSPLGNSMWRVSEATTGFYVADEATPNQVLKAAKAKLLEVGKREIRGAFEKSEKLISSLELIDNPYLEGSI